MIIGRVGCFSAGVYEQAYGIPSSLPWAMDLGDGIARHPVALYEIVYLLLLSVALRIVQKKYPLQPGALFKLMMIAYLVFRLLLDIIKPGWRYTLGLGSIQLACIAGLLYYHRYLLHPRTLIKI
jgi:prolipoprotein diacylglyceryltransferase